MRVALRGVFAKQVWSLRVSTIHLAASQLQSVTLTVEFFARLRICRPRDATRHGGRAAGRAANETRRFSAPLLAPAWGFPVSSPDQRMPHSGENVQPADHNVVWSTFHRSSQRDAELQPLREDIVMPKRDKIVSISRSRS